VSNASVSLGAVYCIGRNYAQHAAELNNPVPSEPIVFMKSAAAIRGLSPQPMAFASEAYDHEVEVVLQIGKRCELGSAPGWEAISAITLGLDLTRREEQNRLKTLGLPWENAKNFAGSGVLAQWQPIQAFPQPDGIEFFLKVRGETRQQGNSKDMLFSVPTILRHLCARLALNSGDVIFTGTPPGVGKLRVGDPFEIGFVGGKAFAGQL
jgi:2-keto-4-pentenoate hydratase/2-oxohepta-3-ene-1,7-dioic acid hydratase in catechol pathway